MANIVFPLGIGILFWLVLTAQADWEILLLGFAFSVISVLIVKFRFNAVRMLSFMGILLFSVLVAYFQALSMLVKGYSFESAITERSKPLTDEEIFTKITTITLTPLTVVIDDTEQTLVIHHLVKRREV
ncbi:MAG: hypothetical protein DRP33_00440 [Thermotogae bacterium]|nr:MAG: hypothetical protein DRP33_00440 [Thermotogota bacterium]